MRRFLLILLILLAGTLVWINLSGNTHIYQTLRMTVLKGKMGPDIYELNDFPYRTLSNRQPKVWPLSTHIGKIEPTAEQLTCAERNETVALLVLHHDSIVYEKYYEAHNKDAVSNSFSMSKSMVGMLFGCALQDQLIPSIDEPIGHYLPAYADTPFNQITIRHLLTMSSGLDFKESYGSLLGWPAKAYYGNDVNATVMQPVLKFAPGTVQEYKGGDTQLLGRILEKVTHERVADYAARRLWQPLGAEHEAYWSLDEKGMEKVSCCLYATARDFARIVSLYMHHGQWNGQQLLDSAYVAQSLEPALLKGTEGQPKSDYGFQWWRMQHHGKQVFYMRGIRGQYVLAVPEEQLLVVRLGHKREEKKGSALPADIAVYLDLGETVAGLR